MTLGIVLLQGPMRGMFLLCEVPLWWTGWVGRFRGVGAGIQAQDQCLTAISFSGVCQGASEM